MVAKANRPHQESTPAQWKEIKFRAAEDATYASHSSSFAPPPSSRVKAFLAAILDQFQLIRDGFGTPLDHFSDEMCLMNTKIGRIARRQSCLGGFVASPEHDPSVESFASGDDSGYASSLDYDDEMMTFQ